MSARAVVACVLLPLAVVAVRMRMEGAAALAEADRLGERADLESVNARIAALGKAARRALPFGPTRRAREDLAVMGRAGARGAWDELRAAILATRALTTPSPDLLAEANRALATERAGEELGAGAGLGERLDPRKLEARRALYLAQLERTSEPHRAHALLAIAGLVLLLVGAARVLSRGVARAPLVAAALGLAIFVLGLWRA